MDLLAPDFDVVHGRAAYDVAEVDEAVAETRRLLAADTVLPDLPGRGGFTLTREAGYDARQVDTWSAAVRREIHERALVRMHEDQDDPPELRGITHHGPGTYEPGSSFPAWVRLTALVLVVAVALFFVASYFV